MEKLKRIDYTAKILPLVVEPDPRLHQVSASVEIVTPEIQKLMEDMLYSMYHYHGIGLTAVQVGVMRKVIVIDVDQATTHRHKCDDSSCDMHIPLHGNQPLFMINAEITWASKEKQKYCEGCLSLPGIDSEVERPSVVKVKYLDYWGQEREEEFGHNLLSVCVQHEIDHSNGIVFIDHLSRLKRDVLRKKMLKAKR